MDAAQSLWRPLGAMLVEHGLLTVEELEDVLTEQEGSGRRLGEIIVDRGLISGPTLALTLAEQWGVELSTDEGFGTGLRDEIQRRHEGERRRRPRLRAVTSDDREQAAEAGAEAEAPEAEDIAAALRAELEDRYFELSDLKARVAEGNGRVAELEEALRERQERVAVLEAQADERQEARGQEAARLAHDELQLAALLDARLSGLEATLGNRSQELERKFSLTAEKLLDERFETHAAELAEVVARLDGLEKTMTARIAEILEHSRDAGLPADTFSELGARLEERSKELERRFSAAAEEFAASLESRTAESLEVVVARLDHMEELMRAGTAETLERCKPPERQSEATPNSAQNERAEREPVVDEKAEPAAAEHLVFFPGESGYSLIPLESAPPAVGAQVVLGDDGETFVVSKVARSPFPRDERPCAYLQRLQ